MSRRARTDVPRTTLRRVLAAVTLTVIGSATVVVTATAEEPTEPSGVTIRTIAVTPSDRIEPVVFREDDELTTALLAAVETRRDLVAEEPEPEPAPAPAPAPEPAPAAAGPPSGSVWDRLAQCESGGNWSINTGNGYYGGLQFNLDSWRWVGGSGYPHEASRAEQIARAEILLSRQGWSAWPACSRKLGLR